MNNSAYLFEIRQIQRFIFATGKLRDASGASELLDQLAASQLNKDGTFALRGIAGKVAEHLKLQVDVYRAAGGVLDICGPTHDTMAQFRALFRFAVALRAPGIEFNDCLATDEDVEAARAKARNGMSTGGPMRGMSLPLGSPMIRPAPLSGGSPAFVKELTKNGRCKITNDYADRATLLKRAQLERPHSLTDKFTPDGRKDLHWPKRLSTADDATEFNRKDDFAFGEKSLPRLAVLHADGNGMGKLFKTAAGSLDREGTLSLSRALGEATEASARDAMRSVVKAAIDGRVPARPILLGGDDMSIILRADLAMDFALDFARAFQSRATEAVRSFGIPEDEVPDLTTKIGFAVIAPGQPFALAYGLAESLAKAAKAEQKSRIAFHRVASADIPESADALRSDGSLGGGLTLWKAAHDLEEILVLREVAELLNADEVGRGPLRRVPELLRSDRAEAAIVYKRALDMVKDRAPEVSERLSAALAKVGVPDLATGTGWCALLQAHDLAHVLRRQG